MSMAIITQAATAITGLEAEVRGKMGSINAEVNAKKAEVDTFLTNARLSLTAPNRLAFDSTIIHSKASLSLAPDPANNSQSIWRKMIDLQNSAYIYQVSAQTHFAALILGRSEVIHPGFYEQNKFSLDKSVSEIEFVVAPNSSENIINSYLAAKVVAPGLFGTWSKAAQSNLVPILDIPGFQDDKCLFMRFKNRAVTEYNEVPDDTLPQPIAAFGGNTIVSIHHLNVHHK